MILDYSNKIKADLHAEFPYCSFTVARRFASHKRRFMYSATLNSGPVAITARNTFMIILPSGGIPGGVNKENRAETLMMTKLGQFVADSEHTLIINLSNGYKVIEDKIAWKKIYAIELLKNSK